MENCRMDISVNETVSPPVDFLELIAFLDGDLVGYLLKLMAQNHELLIVSQSDGGL